ncbi:MAG: hypothetical protein HRU35_04300 [Rickettsiaceae bacterium]|nr:hypothetical protein [Rickettsiaceae bacterium]
MKLIINVLLFFNLILCINSCGFSPSLANNNSSARKYLEDIEIEVPSTIKGVIFYDHLKNILPFKATEAKYLLKIKLVFSEAPSFVMGDNSDILRKTKHLITYYTLLDNKTGKVITNGNFLKIASYSTTFSPYSNTINETAAMENLANVAAEEVKSRLSLFFIHNNK